MAAYQLATFADKIDVVAGFSPGSGFDSGVQSARENAAKPNTVQLR